MSGTNAVAAKGAIFAALAAAAGLAGVQVTYVWPGRTLERETVYGGKIRSDDDLTTFRPGGGRQPRRETATITWYVEVRHVDSDAQAADTRAVQLGTVLEETIAADPTLGGVVLAAVVQSRELEPVRDDDGMTSVLTYDISVRSDLT